MPEINWQRRVEILKAATDTGTSLSQIASRFNVSKGTVWKTVNDFTTTYQLTEEPLPCYN
ncbi:MAG: helix-turn-helix domain-containing protein [Nitrososphaeraceae archaeon]